jgi:hypothetical protein
VIVSLRGETWIYFILGSVVEVALLLTIALVAWAWPRRPADNPPSASELNLVTKPSDGTTDELTLDAAWLGHSPDLNACWLR